MSTNYLDISIEEAMELHRKHFPKVTPHVFKGQKFELHLGEPAYPKQLANTPDPPPILYGVGNIAALQEGLAIIGARKATPYGTACAKEFSKIAAEHGIVVTSGGALGCDSEAHRAALEAQGTTVVVLGGGCDFSYPMRNRKMFQEVIDSGGALVSERDWVFPPLPYTFRARNRIIAGLSKATLIVEAGLPSGTFSTADEALEANRDVLAVPGAITSPTSEGANQLIFQGATPIVNRKVFEDVLVSLFSCMRIEDFRVAKMQGANSGEEGGEEPEDRLLAALNANPLRIDQMLAQCLVPAQGRDSLAALTMELTRLEQQGLIAHFPDGRYGPAKVS